MQVEYSCVQDMYTRVGGDTMQGWGAAVQEVENVLRKEETDWRMVYLARTEGSRSASVTWAFNLTGRHQHGHV